MSSRFLPLFASLVIFAACSSTPGEDSSATGGSSAGDDVTFPSDESEAGVAAFLDTQKYRVAPWVGDAEPRASVDTVSPHGRVRVYFNPTAVDSIESLTASGAEGPHLEGTMVVKELYDEAGTQIGVAASLKTDAGEANSSWTYYCEGSTGACGTSGDATPYFAVGPSACQTCHGQNIYAPLP